jgi:hypothetical protein
LKTPFEIRAFSGARWLEVAVPATGKDLLFFLEVFQFFLEAALGEHVLEFAPGRFALFRGGILVRTRTAVDESIELLLLFVAFRNEVVIEIEVVVVSLHHAILKKPEESIRSGAGGLESLRTIYDAPPFSMVSDPRP